MLKFKKSEIQKAIKGSGGYMSRVALKLGCDWSSAKKYISIFGLEEMLKEEDERINDLAEMKLLELINQGNLGAIIFRLKTRAKDRGYIEQYQFGDMNNSQPIVVNLLPKDVQHQPVIEATAIDAENKELSSE